jgi:hypothetical protein
MESGLGLGGYLTNLVGVGLIAEALKTDVCKGKSGRLPDFVLLEPKELLEDLCDEASSFACAKANFASAKSTFACKTSIPGLVSFESSETASLCLVRGGVTMPESPIGAALAMPSNKDTAGALKAGIGSPILNLFSSGSFATMAEPGDETVKSDTGDRPIIASKGLLRSVELVHDVAQLLAKRSVSSCFVDALRSGSTFCAIAKDEVYTKRLASTFVALGCVSLARSVRLPVKSWLEAIETCNYPCASAYQAIRLR